MHVAGHPQDGYITYMCNPTITMWGRSELPSHFPGISSRWHLSSTLSWRVKWRYSYIGSFWSYPLFACSISHFVTCYVFLYCAASYRWQWPSLSASIYTSSWFTFKHKEVDTRILQTYQFREWCIKPNQIPMSWSLLCMCCKEQLPWLYVLIYAIYIPQTDLLDMGRKRCWNLSWKIVHYVMPWLWRER